MSFFGSTIMPDRTSDGGIRFDPLPVRTPKLLLLFWVVVVVVVVVLVFAAGISIMLGADAVVSRRVTTILAR